MAKPRSFRCRALFTFDLPQNAGGTGWGGEGAAGAREAGFGAAWAVLLRGGRPGLWGARPVPAPWGSGQAFRPGLEPTF